MARKAPHLLISEGDVPRYALLPGDPGRVLLIGEFLEGAEVISRNREFTVLVGRYRGIEVAAVSTGIGGPSAAIAVEELAMVGTEVFIRVGTCGALIPGVGVGELVIPYGAVRRDGTSARYVDLAYPAVPHPNIYRALVDSAKELGIRFREGIIVSDDAFYGTTEELLRWGKLGVVAVEMESSTIFTVASLKGLKAGAILAVDGNIAEGTGKGEVGAAGTEEHGKQVKEAIRAEIKVALEAVKKVASSST